MLVPRKQAHGDWGIDWTDPPDPRRIDNTPFYEAALGGHSYPWPELPYHEMTTPEIGQCTVVEDSGLPIRWDK